MEKEELLLIHGTEYKEMTKEILYAAGLEAQIGARDKKIGIKPIIFYLLVFHLVPYKTMREQWRFIYVGMLAASAVVTPDASPITMFLMFAAVIVLYEASLFVARRVLIARDGKESLKWTRDEYQEHKFNEE